MGYAVDEVINKKRKLFSLVLCLAALCIGGCTEKDSALQQTTDWINADSALPSSGMQAPAHIQEEFSSESGISRVIVDADQLSLHVEERTAGVAGVYRRIRLRKHSQSGANNTSISL